MRRGLGKYLASVLGWEIESFWIIRRHVFQLEGLWLSMAGRVSIEEGRKKERKKGIGECGAKVNELRSNGARVYS